MDEVISPEEAQSRYGQYATIGGLSRVHNAGARFNASRIDEDMPFLVTPRKAEWSQGHIDAGRRVSESIGRSTVTPDHMRGMQFIHLVSGTDPEVHPGGQYSPPRNSAFIPTDISQSDANAIVPHEIGHHVDYKTHGNMSKSKGYNEAVATNFGEKHQAPGTPKHTNHYDDMSANGTLARSLGSESDAEDYNLVRKHGRIAGAPRPGWA